MCYQGVSRGVANDSYAAEQSHATLLPGYLMSDTGSGQVLPASLAGTSTRTAGQHHN